MNPAETPPAVGEARLAAYLMSGSLRYAQELADDAEAEAAAGRSPLAAALDRCRQDLADRPPRSLPLWAAAATRPPDGGPDAPPRADVHTPSRGRWLEPFPDDLYPASTGPAGRYEARETIDLPFVAALQRLSPPERGLVILHDVLGLAEPDGGAPAEPAAARAAFASARAAVGGPAPAPPSGDESIAMMRFIFSCESADRDGLRALLTSDAVLQSVPDGAVHAGRDAVADRLLGAASGPAEGADAGGPGVPHGAPGAPAAGLQRLLPRRANGRLAFGVYRRASHVEPFRAHALYVVALDGPQVAGIVGFHDPALFPDFDLLPALDAQGERPSR